MFHTRYIPKYSCAARRPCALSVEMLHGPGHTNWCHPLSFKKCVCVCVFSCNAIMSGIYAFSIVVLNRCFDEYDFRLGLDSQLGWPSSMTCARVVVCARLHICMFELMEGYVALRQSLYFHKLFRSHSLLAGQESMHKALQRHRLLLQRLHFQTYLSLRTMEKPMRKKVLSKERHKMSMLRSLQRLHLNLKR